MILLNRTNPRGLPFFLKELSEERTSIHFKEKSITVDCDIREISQRWYNWCIKGHYIQDAFDNLDPEEREFLITGIDQVEWEEIFKKGEER